MRTIHKILLASSLSILLPFAAYGQSISDLQELSPEVRRTYMESMSDDERTAMREKWSAEYENLPEEEKKAIRENRAANQSGRNRGRDREAMRQRWDSMSEVERAAAKERRQGQTEKRRAQWESMSEEERAAAREQRGDRKGQRQERHHKAKGKRGDGKLNAGPGS